MAKDIVIPFTSTSEATTETPATGSPYTYPGEGILQKVILNVSGEAATSLIEMGHIKLASKSWGNREVVVGFQGAGIRTAPAFPLPVFQVDQLELPCPKGTVITCVVKHTGAATPVTFNAQVILELDT